MDDETRWMPDAGDAGEWRRLPPVAARCRVLGWLAITGTVAVLAAVVLGWRVVAKKSLPTALWVGATAVLALLLFSTGWSYLAARRERWRLGPTAIEHASGLIGRHWRMVPLVRWQHVDVEIGPIQRSFGLATVRVHTAAGSAVVQLDDVLAADAELVQRRFLESRRPADV